jgi:polycystin domain-containing protein
MIESICENDYSYSNEEKNSFEIGWINETIIKSNSTIEQAFQYQSSNELDTYVYIGDYGSYSGGGYVYEFRGRLSDMQNNLSVLHQLGWIDKKTRAIIIQLTLYNPNVQLFTSCTLLTEFLSTGGIYPQSRFEPMNFYGKFSFFCLIKDKIISDF